ncbi:MAG: DUF188 domain-containing protein [bacterium]
MKVFVDGDACPVLQETIDTVKSSPVIVVHNRHHDISMDSQPNVQVHETGDRSDRVDFYIYNRCASGDIVITDDLGLASLVLSRGATVLRFRGDVVEEDEIDQRLMMRHEASRQRRKTGRQSGPPALTEEDRNQFRNQLKQLLSGE